MGFAKSTLVSAVVIKCFVKEGAASRMSKGKVALERDLVIKKRYSFIAPKMSLWEDRSSQPNRLDDLYKSFGSAFPLI